jgi:hypothetical protein
MRSASHANLRAIERPSLESVSKPKRLSIVLDIVFLAVWALIILTASGYALGLHRSSNKPACCAAQGAR